MLLLAGLWLTPLNVSADELHTLSPLAKQLRRELDSFDVEHHWLPKLYLKNWRTGEPNLEREVTSGSHTHCSAFVAAACEQLNTPMLLPPPQNNLANLQAEWLAGDGRREGWKRVSAVDAQRLANRGIVVVASFKNTDEDYHGGHGHIAVVRPAIKDEAAIAKDGPQITQAGGHNYESAALKLGFPRAWKRRQVLFYAHDPTAQ
jgi:hypothetical protein